MTQGGVTASAHNGRYVSVWKDEDDQGADGIHAQFVVPYAVYLPIILSNH